MDVIQATVLWSLAATGLTFLAGLPVAYVLARVSFAGKTLVLAAISLPMVLPPTAVGYLLLLLLGSQGPFSSMGLDGSVLFSGTAVVLACSVMSAPLVIRTARVAFEAVDPRLEQVAWTLGYSRLRTLFSITLPLASRGLAAAALLGFTRSLGEFGATIMIAGAIPGRTLTLASALYRAQQSGDDALAQQLLGVSIAIGVASVIAAEVLVSRPGKG